MKCCIYCDATNVKFNREHVIPRCFGTFEPLNPALIEEDGLVCANCNSAVFSRLETIMKEDTDEGLLSAQLNLAGSDSVRILGRRIQITSVPGFGDGFIDGVFPFLKLDRDRGLVVHFIPQVKVRNYGDGYQVIPVETLKRKRRQPREFEKMKRRLSSAESRDVSVVIGGDSKEDDDLDDVIALLHEYGIPYNEGKRWFQPMDQAEGKQWVVEVQCTVDRDIKRVLAKVALNYFAFCALQDGCSNILYLPEFEKVRKFIRGDDESTSSGEIAVSYDRRGILGEEISSGRRLLGHVLTFRAQNEKVIANISFLGRMAYEIILGDLPRGFDGDEFGCGHVFDPFERTIHNLNGRPTHGQTEEDARATFGLSKRFRMKSDV